MSFWTCLARITSLETRSSSIGRRLVKSPLGFRFGIPTEERRRRGVGRPEELGFEENWEFWMGFGEEVLLGHPEWLRCMIFLLSNYFEMKACLLQLKDLACPGLSSRGMPQRSSDGMCNSPFN